MKNNFNRMSLPLVLICFFCLASAAISGPPDGFRQLTWGTSPSGHFLKLMAGPTSDGISMYVPVHGKSTGPLMGVPITEEAYSFAQGKFYSGSAWLDGSDNFLKMKDALAAKFGQPSFANESSGVWKWSWPNRKTIVMLTYQQKFKRSTVLFENDGI